jgi:hypothetical protein
MRWVDNAARLASTKAFGYVYLAAFVGTFCLYKFAGVGVVPFVIVGVAGVVIGVCARAWMWASAPPKPGEFREPFR